MAEESRFAKIATVSVTQSAANALTFTGFQTGVGLQVGSTRGKGIAMLIDQIDYYCKNLSATVVGTLDTLRYGITTSNQITAVEDLEDRRILHAAEVQIAITTSGIVRFHQPHSHQFFPAMIWAEPELFFATDGESLGAAADMVCRIYYRIIELDQQLIFEVAQSFRIIS